MLYSSILVLDFGYYNLERFKLFAGENILFVSRIKRNDIYSELGRVNGDEMIRMNNGLYLRIVRVNIDRIEYRYITDIMNLYDRYICYCI